MPIVPKPVAVSTILRRPTAVWTPTPQWYNLSAQNRNTVPVRYQPTSIYRVPFVATPVVPRTYNTYVPVAAKQSKFLNLLPASSPTANETMMWATTVAPQAKQIYGPSITTSWQNMSQADMYRYLNSYYRNP